MGGKTKLRKSERQARILGELRASPAIRISALAGEFGVSTETIRRDLDEVNQQGVLSRTYGGGGPRAPAGPAAPPEGRRGEWRGRGGGGGAGPRPPQPRHRRAEQSAAPPRA